MSKADQINWTTRDRIASHEAYLRGDRPISIAAQLNWTVGESATPTPDEEIEDASSPDVAFPDTLTDDPKDSDDAIDHSDGTKAHDTSAGFAVATNWDALLDTAGVPTDGTPPDPLAAQQQQQQMEEEAARQAMSRGAGMPGSSPGSTPSAPAPAAPPGAQDKANQKRRAGRGIEGDGNEAPGMPAAPAPPAPVAPPGAQDKANQKRRAGRGVEGCGDEGPTNPMAPGNKYDWDSFSTTPRI